MERFLLGIYQRRVMVIAAIAAVFLSWSSWAIYQKHAAEPDYSSIPERKPAPILPNALTTYTRDQYPKTYATWGESGVSQIAEMEKRAADFVSRSRDCDAIEYVGLSESRSYSASPREIVVFVDCSNRNRFYVGERQLSKHPGSLVPKKI
ncbi:hypothetical protein LJR232_004979 [Aquipseudomonas alcaligenes]